MQDSRNPRQISRARLELCRRQNGGMEFFMKISEVAEITGLEISTIRFYERKGLILPDREKGNTYRSYTDEDVNRLKAIILYRKMDLSIEMIKSIILDGEDLQTVLRRQEEILKEEREHLDGALDLCEKIIQDQAADPLDLDYYLNYVKKEESQGRKYPEVMEKLEGLAEKAGLERYVGFPVWTRLMRYKWLRRFTGAALILILIVFPVFMVAEKALEWKNGQADPQAFIAWTIIMFIFISGFVNIIKRI